MSDYKMMSCNQCCHTGKAYDFIDTIGQDKVGIYTSQASFFIILSIFPFILLFFNLIGHASINQNTIIYLIHSYAPDSLKPLFVQVVSEIYEHVSSTAVSITAIAAIWSASKGVLSVMFGKVKELITKNK